MYVRVMSERERTVTQQAISFIYSSMIPIHTWQQQQQQQQDTTPNNNINSYFCLSERREGEERALV